MAKKKLITNVFFGLKLVILVFVLLFNLFVHNVLGQENTGSVPESDTSAEQKAEDSIKEEDLVCCKITKLAPESDEGEDGEGCYSVGTDWACQQKSTKEIQGNFDKTRKCFYDNFTIVEKRDSLGSYCLSEDDEKDLAKGAGIISAECLAGKQNLLGCIKGSVFSSSGLPGPKTSTPIVNKNLILTYIGLIINLILGFLGIIFLIIIIYAGIQWLIAADDENKIKEQKDRLKNAVIGVVITLMAYGLSYFILSIITRAS